MASYKNFAINEIVNTKTPIYENIPITGTIVSGTYSENNIKTYPHGLFTSVYDYPYLSSSANQIFDTTVGMNSDSLAYSAANTLDPVKTKKKVNIYAQMAKVLAGHDITGSILKLDSDGNFNNTGDLINETVFVNFSRLLVKDEIKKGTFKLTLGTGTSSTAPFNSTMIITDVSSNTNYGVNSPVGEYGILQVTTTGSNNNASQTNLKCGMIFYQAGIIALSTNIFAASGSSDTSVAQNKRGLLTTALQLSGSSNIHNMLTGSTIDDISYGLRNRIQSMEFNNTLELNSSIYFCKIGTSDFNYSSNETYVASSQIVVKNKKEDAPISYFTTVGLYSPTNELLAVAKVSEPIRKDNTTDLTLRVRLDF